MKSLGDDLLNREDILPVLHSTSEALMEISDRVNAIAITQVTIEEQVTETSTVIMSDLSDLSDHVSNQMQYVHDQLTDHKNETVEALNATNSIIPVVIQGAEERIVQAVDKRINRNQTTVLVVLFAIFLVNAIFFAKLLIAS